MKNIIVSLVTVLTFVFFVFPALADTLTTVDFEAPYTVGNINAQQSWMKTGPYDAAVALVSNFPNASLFGFGTQALRISNAITSGAFGDQTFSPGLSNPAGESTGYNHFEASFDIGSTLATEQVGLRLSVSPDDGVGSRMSYVGFRDLSDGIHVIFYDTTDAGPLGTVATFNFSDVATIDRNNKHSIKLTIDFVPGPANDVVKLYVDSTLEITGTTWEDYYRFDPEQSGGGNLVPTTSKLLFLEGGTAVPATAGNGFLIDNVSLMSSNVIAETEEDNSFKVDIYHVTNCTSNEVSTTPYKGHVTLIAPDGKNDLMIQGVIKGLEPKTTYTMWVRDLTGYEGTSIEAYAPLGYFALTTFTTDKKGDGNFHYKINKADLPSGEYHLQVALNYDNNTTYGCTAAATARDFLTVTVGE